jgi:hypothetical protein
MLNCSHVKALVITVSIQMSFPEMVSDNLQEFFVQTHSFIRKSWWLFSDGGWSHTVLQVKKLDVEVLGWCGCEAGWTVCQIL